MRTEKLRRMCAHLEAALVLARQLRDNGWSDGVAVGLSHELCGAGDCLSRHYYEDLGGSPGPVGGGGGEKVSVGPKVVPFSVDKLKHPPDFMRGKQGDDDDE